MHRLAHKGSVRDACSPLFSLSRRLGLGVLQDYSKLRSDTQAKNIAAWTPVIGEILRGFCRFDDKAVSRSGLAGWGPPR